MYLFARHRSDTIIGNYAKAKIYYCKIWDNDILVRDFIPVRVGNVGYMYDLVSGKLFENAGGGNFILGGDIVPVEYIGSTGTQYINTKLNGTTVTRFIVNGTCKSPNYVNRQLLGGTKEGASTFFGIVCISSTQEKHWYCYNNGNHLGNPSNHSLIDVTINSSSSQTGTLTDLVTNQSFNFPSFNYSSWGFPNEDLLLFGGYNTRISPDATCYGLKLYTNDGLVRDFIPVRIGTTGYMYDMVSHQLFGNAGTGSFTYGEDIIPVEYLESSGTQFIDTFVNLSSALSMQLNFSLTKIATSNSLLTGVWKSTGLPRAQLYVSSYGKFINSGNATVSGITCGLPGTSTGEEALTNKKYNVIFNINAQGDSEDILSMSMYIFARNEDNGSYLQYDGMRLYSCKIYSNNILIRDFIPVRVGTVGCMYDKVSHQLFYNAGTGAFTYGFDVYPRKSISHINAPELPGGFKRLDYVKNAVCGRALNMQIDFAYDMAYKAELRLAGTLIGTQQLLGLYGSGGSARTLWANGSDMKFRSSYNRVNANATNGRSYETFNLNDADYNKHTFTAIPYNDNGTLRLSVSMDSTVKQGTLYEIYHATNTAKFYLFGLRESADEDIAKIPIEIYSLTIYNANGTEAANFIPCRHTSTDKVGFFDTVNKRFITDSFLIGSDEEIPSEYEKVDYVVNTANEVLDTGIDFGYKTQVYIDYRLTEITTGVSTNIVGGGNNNDAQLYWMFKDKNNDNKIRYGYIRTYTSGSHGLSYITTQTADTNRHLSMFNSANNYSQVYTDGALNGGSLLYDQTATTRIYLFGTSATSPTDVPIEIYSLIIYNPDGTKALEYVPVKKPSTGEIGFYDKINRNFITRSWLSCYAPEEDYMQINSRGNGNVTINIPSSVSSTRMTSISWSKDRINWNDLIIDNTDQVITVPVASNETVFLKGDGKKTCYSPSAHITITSSANYDISGNIMSLLYGDDFINKTSFPDDSTYTFYGLFDGSTTVINAKNLILPATTLTTSCYYSMFQYCTSLVSAPKLPATTLASSCYYYMFRNTAIVKAPTLSAETLTNNCYRGMFYNCNNLNYVKMLATDISASSCLQAWLYGVASTGTFVKAASMTELPSGTSGIPANWTVEDAS